MPLTDAELREVYRARLEGLLADLTEARQSGDDPSVDEAKRGLLDYQSPYQDLNEEASKALEAAINADLTSAVAEFAQIANRIGTEGGTVRSGLERARAAAESRKKELLVPRIAETSTKALSELKALEGGIKDLIDQAGDVGDLGEVADLLPQAIDQLSNLRAAAKQLGLG